MTWSWREPQWAFYMPHSKSHSLTIHALQKLFRHRCSFLIHKPALTKVSNYNLADTLVMIWGSSLDQYYGQSNPRQSHISSNLTCPPFGTVFFFIVANYYQRLYVKFYKTILNIFLFIQIIYIKCKRSFERRSWVLKYKGLLKFTPVIVINVICY